MTGRVLSLIVKSFSSGTSNTMDSAIARSSDGQCIPFANRALERRGHAAADTLYLALTGGTLTGRLTIDRTGDHEALVINQHGADSSAATHNPHSLRDTRAHLGETLCQSPEQFKAWSQNLGHEKVLTTLTSYGAVGNGRQG